MENFIQYKGSAIHFRRSGKGKEVLLAFHGFGENASSFEVLLPTLGKFFKIIAVDLPLHGDTKWDKNQVFYKNDLAEIIKMILSREEANTFSLMGYSLGGKIGLACVELFPMQINKIILIAPDGLKENLWYNIAVYPKWGRDLFRYFIKKPTWFFLLADTLRTIRLLPTSLHKFVYQQMETEPKRQLVYDVWTNIADFTIDRNLVKRLINENHIRLYMIFGKYDKVILPEFGEKFKKGMNDSTMILLEKGHRLIDREMNGVLEKLL